MLGVNIALESDFPWGGQRSLKSDVEYLAEGPYLFVRQTRISVSRVDALFAFGIHDLLQQA